MHSRFWENLDQSKSRAFKNLIYLTSINRSNIIDELRKKQENLKREIKKEEELIRINRTKSRKVALKALQRKKLLESRLKRNKGALQTLIYGSQYSETKQPIINNVSSDEIVTNDIVLTLDAAQNVSHIISNPMGFSQDFDEEELIKELEEMENQEINSSIEPSLATKSGLLSFKTKNY